MPRTTSTRLPAADRREEIVRAARKLFAERGYDGTSIEDIGGAVGLTGPAIYRHFKNKVALFVATFAGADGASEEAMARAVDEPPAEAIVTVLRAEAEVAVRHREAMLMWQRERMRMPRRMRRERTDRRQRMYGLIERCLESLRPDLSEDEIVEMRNVITSIALGAADQESHLSDEARIDFMVSAGWTMIKHAAPPAQRGTNGAAKKSRARTVVASSAPN